MSNVISFSLWGNDPKYTEGAIKNAKLASEIYPDWKCLFYLGVDVPIEIKIRLADMDNVELQVMPRHLQGWKGMFARFLPAAELGSDVQVMISRDCDSRLTMRERAAVNEWLESNKGFHIMRDHPWHTSQIMGGMWGIRSGCLPEFGDLMSGWIVEDRWQTDQEFLNTEIYPRIVSDAIIHASFFRVESMARDFPQPRINTEFVGQVFDEHDATVMEHIEVLKSSL